MDEKVVHAKAPLRLGLAGGGTDVAPYSETYGGLVLNATISLFSHCRIIPCPENSVCFESIDFNEKVSLPASDALPLDGPLVLHRAVYNRIVAEYNDGQPLPIRVVTFCDVPPGSGIGSSSSLVVAMVQAYAELLELSLGEYDIAHLAYEIERIDCAMAGGKQDQFAATFGGFNFMEFNSGDRVLVNPLRLKKGYIDELESRLLLYYTGRSRSSAQIIKSQIAAVENKDHLAVNAMHDLKYAAVEMKGALIRGYIDQVLEILGRSWAAKARMAKDIANPYIDEIAFAAERAGAIGLKISGAGGGGFMMIGADVTRRYDIIRSLNAFEGRFFGFTFIDHGARSWRVR